MVEYSTASRPPISQREIAKDCEKVARLCRNMITANDMLFMVTPVSISVNEESLRPSIATPSTISSTAPAPTSESSPMARIPRQMASTAPTRRAARNAQRVRFRQRIAQHALEQNSGDRQRRAADQRQQHSRQSRIERKFRNRARRAQMPGRNRYACCRSAAQSARLQSRTRAKTIPVYKTDLFSCLLLQSCAKPDEAGMHLARTPKTRADQVRIENLGGRDRRPRRGRGRAAARASRTEARDSDRASP